MDTLASSLPSPSRTIALTARAAESSGVVKTVGGYVPVQWAIFAGAGVYGGLAILAWIFLARYGRKWFLIIPISLTAMAGGFALRYMLYRSPDSVMWYANQQLFLLLAPCGFIAGIYIGLSRIVSFLGSDTVGKDCLIMRPSWIVKFFVYMDCITFLVQAAGGGMSSMEKLATLGKTLSLVGLIIQLAAFTGYTFQLYLFGFRVRSRYPEIWDESYSRPGNWKALYWVLCVQCIVVAVRCIFRICEFQQGHGGYLMTHEGYFYLLDAAPLAAAMAFFIIFWPPRVLPESGSSFDPRFRPISDNLELTQSSSYAAVQKPYDPPQQGYASYSR